MKAYSLCCFVIMVLLGARASYAEVKDPVIDVPLRFHIIDSDDVEKNGKKLFCRVTEQDIQAIVLPEINRIWRVANIQFHSESVFRTDFANPPNKQNLIKNIVNAQRDAMGKSDAKRIKKLNQLIDWKNHHTTAINIYLVPYLGEKSQGNAKAKMNRVFVTQWTDKMIARGEPPIQFALVEPLPFKQGSLSRTIAHEVGHILGLKHPDKSLQTEFGLLMGGKKAGYSLTSEEITKARQRAAFWK